eukprot:15324415-Heterocapsa_arctica.AAC.1
MTWHERVGRWPIRMPSGLRSGAVCAERPLSNIYIYIAPLLLVRAMPSSPPFCVCFHTLAFLITLCPLLRRG